MANRILINNIEIDRRSSSQSESKDNTMFYRKFSFLGKDTLNISFPVSIKLKEDIEISLINNFDNHNLPFDPNNLDGLTLEETTSIIGNSIDTVEVNAPTGLKHASIFVEDFVKWVTNPKSSLDLKSGVVTVLSGASPRGGKSYTGWLSGYGYEDPKGYLQINNKFVKALSVNGNGFEKLDIEGKEYSFTKNTVATRDAVEAHVLAHTTWATTATIDTSATFKGLTVEYSKSTGITDGEKITATVKAPTNGDLLNGGTTDFVISDITIANPDRTVTQADVDTYVQANLTWSGSPLVAHIDFTKWAMAGTKLSSPDTTWAEGDHTFTVTALPGYTVNGGASADFTVTLTSRPNWADDVYYEDFRADKIFKNNVSIFNGNLRGLVVDKNGNWYGGTDTTGSCIIYKNGVKLYSLNGSLATYGGISIASNGDVNVLTTSAVYRNGTIVTSDSYRDSNDLLIKTNKSNEIYYSAHHNVYKENTKIHTAPATVTNLFVSDTDDLYYIADGKLYKNGTLQSGYATLMSATIGPSGDIYWLDGHKNLYKNTTILFSLANVDRDGNTILVTTDEKDIYTRGDYLLYKNGTQITATNVDSYAIGIEYGSRSGNW